MRRIGIDLGGTKIELIVLDEQGKTLLRRRTDTPQGKYTATLEAILEQINHAEMQLGRVDSIGIGTPGAVSRKTGRMKNANAVCLNGQPLKEDLEKILGRRVSITNDANCFALSEATDGAAAGKTVVFGVIIGTGTGGGVVMNGKVLVGPNAIAGEWGHNPLPWSTEHERLGPACYCGQQGCIETFCSGPGLARDHLKHTGQSLTGKSIAELAETGDIGAEASLQRYENRLARSLASVINLLDPDAIVLGGGVSNIKRLYTNIPKIWGKYVYSDAVDTLILPPRFGDSSGVRGAAWL